MVCTSHGDVDAMQRVGVTGVLDCPLVVGRERLSPANHDERKRSTGGEMVYKIPLKRRN